LVTHTQMNQEASRLKHDVLVLLLRQGTLMF